MAKWLVVILGLHGLLWPIGCEDNKYNNYTLMRIVPHNKQHLEELARLQDDPEGVEILKRSRGLNRTTDVLVSPEKAVFLEEFVKKHGMPVHYNYNYGRYYTFRDFEFVSRSKPKSGYNFYGYNSYYDMLKYIDKLATRASDLVKVQYMGSSFEGRHMFLIKISTNPNGHNPIIFIDAGIHAREWAAPAMAMYLIHRLANDPAARPRELNGIDWYILPLVNPDGYEFTRTGKSNRLWRKTRSKHTTKDCFGVDGNRNFAFEWGGKGTSSDPCDKQIYAGPKPFSETETQIVRNIMMEYRQRIKLYVSLHTYGPYLIYPWGYTGDVLPDKWLKLDNLARMVSDSVVRAGGREFEIMSAGEWYPAAGGSCDYAFGVVGIPYTYTLELTDGFQFTFPKELLHIVMPQYYEGFLTFSVQIKREFGTT